jgi:hypothetical protein
MVDAISAAGITTVYYDVHREDDATDILAHHLGIDLCSIRHDNTAHG